MRNGIMVCGLNGSGKSTLGKALAESLGYYFLDNEDLFFPKDDPSYLYAAPRSREEVEALLMQEVKAHGNFVFAAVKGDYGREILPYYRCAVLVEVPREIRLERVQARSFRKFGNRMLPGGDLYQQEQAFFDMVAARDEEYVEKWVESLHCPVIRVDGTKPVAENVSWITRQVQGLCRKEVFMMNEVLQNIYSRRSTRAYRPDGIPEDTLKEIVKAGLYAPSAMNQQSWHLTVLSGKAAERFRKFAAEKAGRDAYYGAPVIVLVFADKSAAEPVKDGTLAMENMMLAAHSLGVSSCWINVLKHIFKGEEADALAAEWGVPAGYCPVGSLELGYCAQQPREAAPRREGTVTWMQE